MTTQFDPRDARSQDYSTGRPFILPTRAAMTFGGTR